MKSTKLALVIVLLCGTLAACKPEPPPAPAAEAPPPAVEPAPAPEPVVPAEPTTTSATGTETPPDATEETDDTPHSGGDKVGAGTGTGN